MNSICCYIIICLWNNNILCNYFQSDSDKINEQINTTKTQLQIIDKKLEKLQTLSNRPKALRLYEPRIQKV